MNRFVIVSAILAAALPVGAQMQRRASIVSGGGGDRGKCTAEVVVDGGADVEIRGDTGSIRTTSGQPAQWRRLECTGPIPQDPVNFRFAGVDGRGRQQLVRDPRNGGAAVIHIEDSSGGAEGYTFDLFWGAGYNDRNPNDRNFNDRNPNDRPGQGPGYSGGYNRPPGGADRIGPIIPGRRYTTEQAVDICQEEVRRQAQDRFGARDVAFFETRLDDNPGRRDWIIGRIEVRRGFNRMEPHRFACSVDFDSGRVRNVDIDAMGAGRGDFGGPNASTRAIELCQVAAEERIRRDGYRNVDIGSIRMDDQPGRNDWVVGNARAERGPIFASFTFSCSVNLRAGVVRSVNVRRR